MHAFINIFLSHCSKLKILWLKFTYACTDLLLSSFCIAFPECLYHAYFDAVEAVVCSYVLSFLISLALLRLQFLDHMHSSISCSLHPLPFTSLPLLPHVNTHPYIHLLVQVLSLTHRQLAFFFVRWCVLSPYCLHVECR